jgi:hypothetical protein
LVGINVLVGINELVRINVLVGINVFDWKIYLFRKMNLFE